MNNYQKSETTFLLGKIAMVGKQGCGCTISGECIGTRRKWVFLFLMVQWRKLLVILMEDKVPEIF